MSKSIVRSVAVAGFVALACLTVSSCRRATQVPVEKKDPTQGKADDSIGRAAVQAFHYDAARVNDDWTRYRDFLPKLNNYMVKPDVQARVRFADADRSFLTTEVQLTGAEMSDLEAAEFRTADAHYLDECYLMRDAVRAVDPGNLDSAEKQALTLFRWMTRNVLLHEQVDSWIPPAFTVRRGHGGAIERAMVFLALLRQEKLDGCLLVVPDTDPLEFLVGVLDPKTSDVLLFDTRLGLPVAGKSAKSIATLKDAQADPKLLAPSQITPEQAKKLEVRIVCPFHALSQRMLELQANVAGLERVVLHQNPRELAQEIGKATGMPVKVWNPSASEGKAVNSPTRCLDRFLPAKLEGGQDTTGRAAQVAQARMPLANVVANFGQVQVSARLLPAPVYGRFESVVVDLFGKYELQPREMFLRGHYDLMRQRLGRVQPLLKTEAAPGDKEFAEERAAWFKLINTANANLEHPDANVQAKAKALIEALGGTDFVLHWVRDVESEKTLGDLEKELNIKSDQKRSVPTKILAFGLRDQLDPLAQRLQASAAHEKAERFEAMVRGQAKPSKSAAQNAEEGWIMAKSAWANFYLAPIAIDFMIEQRLAQMRTGVKPIVRNPLEEIGMHLSLLETLHLDVQRVCNAKLRLSECLVHTHANGVKGANEYLLKAKQEIEQIEKKGQMREEIRNMQSTLNQLPEPARTALQRRLALLDHDWSDKGTMFWLKQQIDQRVK